MSEFYEPSLLLRQNAIRRGNGSDDSLSSSLKSKTRLSWNNKECEVFNKSCSVVDRLNITSNYWQIPDTNMNLTSMSIVGGQDSNATIAISSGNAESNLFIYDLDVDNKYLSHQSTITLPNIHSLSWAPNNSKYLVTGNSKGYAHLISMPGEDSEDGAAEICKRFNHKKHTKNQTPISLRNSNISKIKFINNQPENLLTIYNSNLFNWKLNDLYSQIRPSPNSITNIQGLLNFDSLNDSIISICGKFGVSLFDLRNPKFQTPNQLNNTSSKEQCAYLMKWSPADSNVFAACHRDGTVRLWDIRKNESFANLYGHQDRISSLEWNDGDLFTGGKDGNIIHWDLTNDPTDLTTCTLKEGLNSIEFDLKSNSLKPINLQRQCGTIIPASNTNIITMGSINNGNDTKVLSIDGSSYFGVHTKIYDVVNDIQEKMFYSNQDLQLLSSKPSLDTLNDKSVEPLELRKSLPFVNFNHSDETLNETNEIEYVKGNDYEEVTEEKEIQEIETGSLINLYPLNQDDISMKIPNSESSFYKCSPESSYNLTNIQSSQFNLLHGIEEVSETSSIYLNVSDFKIELPNFDNFNFYDNDDRESFVSFNDISNHLSFFNESLHSLSTNPTIEEDLEMNRRNIIVIEEKTEEKQEEKEEKTKEMVKELPRIPVRSMII